MWASRIRSSSSAAVTRSGTRSLSPIDASVITAKGATVERFYTYPRFASWLREELNRVNDPAFVVRVLKHTVSDIRDIPDDE